MIFSFLVLFFSTHANAAKLPLDRLQLPQNFQISIYADKIEGARSMTLGPKDTVFVGTRGSDVYAVTDADGDHRAEKVQKVLVDLNMPNGVAWDGSSLYVAEVSKLWRLDGIEGFLVGGDKKKIKRSLVREFPDKEHHGWKFIAFGPDGKIYVPVGAPCNVCLEKDPRFASITRMNKDGTDFEIFAQGIRNSVGFDWSPQGELWFTDNGRDWLGDELPPCELNRAPRAGLHFGFPFCHGGDFLDPEFGKGKKCSDFEAPAHRLGAHVAPLGMRFYRGNQFPKEYTGRIFVAEHGSWNRSKRAGYRVMMAQIKNNRVESYEPFISGWLGANEGVWGRPVDVLNLPDGSLLISDDFAGVIYRVSYQPANPKSKP